MWRSGLTAATNRQAAVGAITAATSRDLTTTTVGATGSTVRGLSESRVVMAAPGKSESWIDAILGMTLLRILGLTVIVMHRVMHLVLRSPPLLPHSRITVLPKMADSRAARDMHRTGEPLTIPAAVMRAGFLAIPTTLKAPPADRMRALSPTQAPLTIREVLGGPGIPRIIGSHMRRSWRMIRSSRDTARLLRSTDTLQTHGRPKRA